MKKILYYILILPVILSGCEKDLMDYKGTEGVYFAVQWGSSWGSEKSWPYQPYTEVQFIKQKHDTVTVSVRVMTTGPVKSYDRTFRVEVNPDSTSAVENVDYYPLANDITIKAGEYTSNIPVKLIRTKALQEKEKTLGLRLVANQYFELSFPEWDAVKGYETGTVYKHFDASLHMLRISDVVVRPAVWPGTDSSPYEDGAESGLWGAFSAKKLDMICKRFNLTYSDFTGTATMPVVLQNLIAKTMSQILIDRYNAKDPVLEDDKRLMFFSGCPWKSKIGVPWVSDENK